MSNLCIYCGQRPATTKDHVPPKSFFPRTRPYNLITVPCCHECNVGYGKNDERVRNLLTSLDATEDHPAILDQLGGRRNRSWQRDKGRSTFQHVLASTKVVDVYSKDGTFLGRRQAFDLNQPEMDRFIGRTTRALLYHEYGIGFVPGQVEWRMAPTKTTIQTLPPQIKELLKGATPRSIGGAVFSYIGYYKAGAAKSLWFLNFYGGVDFMAIFRTKPRSSQPASPFNT